MAYLFAPVIKAKSCSWAGTDSQGAAWATGTADTICTEEEV